LKNDFEKIREVTTLTLITEVIPHKLFLENGMAEMSK
jgi:hypothetical protein